MHIRKFVRLLLVGRNKDCSKKCLEEWQQSREEGMSTADLRMKEQIQAYKRGQVTAIHRILEDVWNGPHTGWLWTRLGQLDRRSPEWCLLLGKFATFVRAKVSETRAKLLRARVVEFQPSMQGNPRKKEIVASPIVSVVMRGMPNLAVICGNVYRSTFTWKRSEGAGMLLDWL